MTSSKTKRIIAVLLTLTLVLGIGVTNLWADTVPDSSKPVSLTVQKYLTPVPSTVAGDGKNGPDLSGGSFQPAPGVEFTLTRLSNVTVNTTVENCVKDTSLVIKGNTDTNGQIYWSASDGLVQGFYLLEETASPYDGRVTAANPDGILADTCVSSIVALPFTNATEYIYNVKVFPKNVGKTNTKTVIDQNNVYRPDDIVKWEIETVIMSQKVETYAIVDQLDSRLDYQGVDLFMVLSDNSSTAALQSGDYRVSTNSNVVTITVSPDGLAKVKAQGATAIRAILTTKINLTAFTNTGGGFIENGAQLIFKNKNGVNETLEIPTPAVITLASIEIEKVDGKNTDTKLSQAEFKIAATEKDALASNFLKKSDGSDMVITTDNKGKASASGIPYTEFSTDANGNESINVYLVETKAPDGYDLLQESVVLGQMKPVVFKITLSKGQEIPGASVTYAPFSGSLMIKNYKGFELPVTGGAGTIMFTIVGVGLILGATGLLIVTRKRKASGAR